MKKNYMKYGTRVLSLLIVTLFVLAGCAPAQPVEDPTTTASTTTTTTGSEGSTTDTSTDDTEATDATDGTEGTQGTQGTQNDKPSGTKTEFVAAVVPTVTTTGLTSQNVGNSEEDKITKPDSGAFTVNSKALSGANKKLTGFTILTKSPKAFEKVEFAMDVPAIEEGMSYYKESDIDITMEMVSSTGQKLKVDAFYYQEYIFKDDKQIGKIAEKDPKFIIRISPQSKGTWDFTVTLAIKGKTVDTVQGYINVAENKAGSKILEVEPVRKQVFKARNGNVTPMIGENLCWNMPIAQTSRYAQYCSDQIEILTEYGANYVRMWDFLDGGGSIKAALYQMDQNASAQWDVIFDTAEKTGMYINFVLIQHGEVSTGSDPRWDASIWHVNKGGYLETSQVVEFYSHRPTIDAFKAYCRYIISRWGYSENVMSWEIFNEIEHTNGVSKDLPQVREWLKEITNYLRELDPYNHLVSNSTGDPGHPLATYNIFDFIYYHAYNYNSPQDTAANMQKNAWLAYKKPILMGEWGMAGAFAAQAGGAVLPDLTYMHHGLWSGVMGGGAGTGMQWHWEIIADFGGQWQFQLVSEISKEIPWDDPEMFMVNTSYVDPSNSQIGAMGYRGKKYAYIWFYDKKYTQLNLRETTFENESATVQLTNGTYHVRWIDTWTGKSVKKEVVKVTDGSLTFTMPTWTKDVVVAITTD